MSDQEPDKVYAELGRLHMLRTLAGLETSVEQGTQMMHSVDSGNYRFLSGPSTEREGYIIWAAIDRHTYLAIKRGGAKPKYRHEWSEGKLVLVLDVVLLAHSRGHALSELMAFTRSYRDIIVARPGRLVRRYRCSSARP